MCQVRLAQLERERQAAFAVRWEVFVQEQGVPLEEELDSYDAEALHFIAEYSATKEIVATARLIHKEPGIGKVGRVAVRKAYRGRGVGTKIMQFIENFATERNFRQLMLDAQLQAIPFYEKLGYTAEGDIFLDAGIEHRRMIKQLAPP